MGSQCLALGTSDPSLGMDFSTSETVRWQLAAIARRGEVAAVGDYYLCPRPYRDRPARVVVSSSVKLSVSLDEAALAHQKIMLGWRVYVTNQPQPELSLPCAVVANP